jgi:hypothetical protein
MYIVEGWFSQFGVKCIVKGDIIIFINHTLESTIFCLVVPIHNSQNIYELSLTLHSHIGSYVIYEHRFKVNKVGVLLFSKDPVDLGAKVA